MNGTTGSLDFFGRAARAGSRLLQFPVPGNNGWTAQHYFSTLEEVFTLLSQIHDEVAQTALEIEGAGSQADAEALLERLGTLQLRQAMKAHDLCDRLGHAGRELTPFIWNHPSLTPSNKLVWLELTTSLQNREQGAAELYMEKLRNATESLAGESSLDDVRKRVRKMRSDLLKQKALFDGLANEARDKKAQLH